MRKLLLSLLCLCLPAVAQNIRVDNLEVKTSVLACNVNGVRYVGGALNCWAGADIGAQINSAYADMGLGGGKLVVLPKTGGGPYAFSTPISFSISGKFILLEGAGVAGSRAGDPPYPGVILEYTPTTDTCAITLDDGFPEGGGHVAHGIRDLAIWNTENFVEGGGTSSAKGICIGATNGSPIAEFSNVKVIGFDTGFYGTTGAVNSWGMQFRLCRWDYNTVGMNLGPWENVGIYENTFLSNGIGLLSSQNTEVNSFGSSWDSNTSLAVSYTGAVSSTPVNFFGDHFENPPVGAGCGNPNFVSGTANFNFVGGIMMNDCTTGTGSWFVSTSGYSFYVAGLRLASAGGGLTQVFLVNNPTRAYIAAVNSAPTTFTTITGGASTAITDLTTAHNNSNINPLWKFESQFKAPLGIGDATFTPSTGAALHIKANASIFDALRLEDSTYSPRAIDLGPNVGGGSIFGIRDVTGAQQLLTLSWTSPFNATFPGRIVAGASIAGGSSLNIPSGTAPTTPAAGDIWLDSAGMATARSATLSTYQWDPTDQTMAMLSDDFVSGLLTTGNIGNLGWAYSGTAACGTATHPASALPNLGIFQTTTGTSSGNTCGITFVTAGELGTLGSVAGWEMLWIFSVPTTTTMGAYVGASDSLTAVPTNWFGARYDTSIPDSVFKLCVNATCDATTYTLDTNFHKLRIWSTTGATIKMQFDANAARTFCASSCDTTVTPSGNSMTPIAQSVTRTTAARNVAIDYFGFRYKSIGR